MNRCATLPLLLCLAFTGCDGGDDDVPQDEWRLVSFDGSEVPVVLETLDANMIPRLPPCDADSVDVVLLGLELMLEDDGALEVAGATQLVYECPSGQRQPIQPDIFDGEGSWTDESGVLQLTIPDEVNGWIGLNEVWIGVESEDGDELVVEASDFEQDVVLGFERDR